jgi:DNA polymerase III subunit chi
MTPRVTFYDIAPTLRFALAAKVASSANDKKLRLIVRCHPHEAAALDQHLWTFREESFVPHEVCDDPERLVDPEARVVITTRDARPIPADILLQLAPCEVDFARAFANVIDVVDHGDPARLDASRARYKTWSESGHRPELKKAV